MNNGPSVTAAVVASTLLLSKDDPNLGHLAPDEVAVRRAVPLFGHLLDTVPWPVLERAAHVAERLVSPGFVTHYALRKIAIRRALASAVAAGSRQVVLVGAGFDNLASSVPADVRVFEVDHPATQVYRGETADNVTLVPVDLTKEHATEALRRTPGFDPSAATVFVAEGLLMYLEEDCVNRVLADLARGPGARTLVLSIVTPDASGKVRIHTQRRVIDWIMRFIDEPFLWGEGPVELRETLGRHGLTVASIVSTMELRDELLPSSGQRRLPRPPGEIVVVANKPAA